ncbi:prolyl oligopeptidase family serine peptidase [Yinghuangia aomiensis]|uniref:prolyl oligopeptidase family serine peptidase n=1 Tax=Yinghuangia aomiensis TaxID=676205 RepID=UPI0031E867AB
MYPQVERSGDVIGLPNGSAVPNPYSALESPGPARDAWRAVEEELRRRRLDPRALARGQELYDLFKAVPKVSTAVVAGDRKFYTRIPPGKVVPQLRVREADGTDRILINELYVSSPGSDARGWYPSPRDATGRQYLAYSSAGDGGGEMAAALVVIDVDTNEKVGEYPYAGFAAVTWAPDASSLITSEMIANEGEAAGSRKFRFRLMEHETGAPYSAGREIHVRDNQLPHAERRPTLSPDGRWLAVWETTGGLGASSAILLQDRTTGESFVVQEDDGATHWLPRFDQDSNLWLWTNHGNGYGKILKMDPSAGAHTVEQADVVVDEHPNLLLESYELVESSGEDPRVAAVMVDRGQVPRLWITDPRRPGEPLVIEAPGAVPVHDEAGQYLGYTGHMGGLAHDPAEPQRLTMTFSDVVSPSDVYTVDIRTGAVENVTRHTPELHRHLPPPALEGVMYERTSSDGAAEIPHLLVSHVGRERADGRQVPVYSFAYGAFGLCDGLGFEGYSHLQAMAAYLGFDLHHSGPRGGVERGRKWGEAGQRKNWGNTVEDRAATEQDLLTRGLATSPQLVRFGVSASGPDVLHMAMRYPGQAAASVMVNPAGGFVDPDMRGYNRRISEYGDPRVSDELLVLIERDPELAVARLAPEDAAGMGTLLLVAALGDDRVSPTASMRLVAALQDKVRDLSGAGDVLFHGSVGGHLWTPTPSSVGMLAATVHVMGIELPTEPAAAAALVRAEPPLETAAPSRTAPEIGPPKAEPPDPSRLGPNMTIATKGMRTVADFGAVPSSLPPNRRTSTTAHPPLQSVEGAQERRDGIGR